MTPFPDPFVVNIRIRSCCTTCTRSFTDRVLPLLRSCRSDPNWDLFPPWEAFGHRTESYPTNRPLPGLLDRVLPLVRSVISCLWPLALSLPMLFTMLDVRRVLDAAGVLSSALRANGVPHAFYGNVFTALLSNSPQAEVRLTICFRQCLRSFHHVLPGDILHRRVRPNDSPIPSCEASDTGHSASLHDRFTLE